MSTNLHSVIVNVLVKKDDMILVSQRSLDEPHEPGKWTIPGGKVEVGPGNEFSVLEATAKRETFEEVGVVISDNMTCLGNNTFIRSDGTHVIVLLFIADWESGEPVPLEDTIAVKWVSLANIDEQQYPENVREYIQKGLVLKS